MMIDAPVIVYRNDGPVFDRRCPKCARFMRFPETIRYGVNGLEMCEFPKIDCSRCGPVDPVHIGWAGDFVA